MQLDEGGKTGYTGRLCQPTRSPDLTEAVTGSMRVIAFDSGVNHYDDPPPGELTDLAGLQGADRSGSPTSCGPGLRSTTPATLPTPVTHAVA